VTILKFIGQRQSVLEMSGTYLKIADRCRSDKCRMIRLTDEQWERIRDHFPEEHISDCRPGRKLIPTRRVVEAVLWILWLALRAPRTASLREQGHWNYGTDQCASSSAWKLASPESNDPVIAIAASTPRGKSTLVIEAMKIAAIGSAMTK
jgi:hypothetical protein